MHALVVGASSVKLLTVEKKRNRIVHWHSIALDLDRTRLSIGNKIIASSPAEFSLLHLLVSRRNLPMTKEFIMSRLFGDDHGRDLRQVDMFVARLRQSLSAVGLAGLIQTVAGRGYAVLDDHDDEAPVRGTQPHGLALAGLDV